eukprot:353093-Chlamydomonas_euryale.AAC.7
MATLSDAFPRACLPTTAQPFPPWPPDNRPTPFTLASTPPLESQCSCPRFPVTPPRPQPTTAGHSPYPLPATRLIKHPSPVPPSRWHSCQAPDDPLPQLKTTDPLHRLPATLLLDSPAERPTALCYSS